jgi:hypothetical protein
MAWDSVEVARIIDLGNGRRTWEDRCAKDGATYCQRVYGDSTVDPASGIAERAARLEEALADAEAEGLIGG